MGSALKQITALSTGAICPPPYITPKRFRVLSPPFDRCMGPFFLIALDLTKYFQHSLKIIYSGLQHSEALPSDVGAGANCPSPYSSDLLKCTSQILNSSIFFKIYLNISCVFPAHVPRNNNEGCYSVLKRLHCHCGVKGESYNKNPLP